MPTTPDTHSDALVFFGATGDLAFKKIFPALQAMARRGDLQVPVIGVAKAGWTIDQLRRYVDHLAECFGAQRLMWGSDWPVLNVGGTYQSWYAATVAMTADWPAADRKALMGGTARRFYGL